MQPLDVVAAGGRLVGLRGRGRHREHDGQGEEDGDGQDSLHGSLLRNGGRLPARAGRQRPSVVEQEPRQPAGGYWTFTSAAATWQTPPVRPRVLPETWTRHPGWSWLMV